MLEEISAYLSQNTTPDFNAAVADAFALFDQYGVAQYDQPYLGILLASGNMDPMEVRDRFYEQVQEHQDDILREMDITLSESASIYQGNLVLTVLKQLESTDLYGEIGSICEQIDSPVARMAAIMATITGGEEENYLEVFEEVGDATLSAIQAMMRKWSDIYDYEDRVIDVQADAQYKERLMGFRAFVQNKELYIYDELLQGTPLGLRFQEYYERLIERIQNTTPTVIAMQLYAAAMVASDTQTNPLGPIKAELNKTFSSVDTITPITMVLETQMLKFLAAQNSGVKKV